MKKIFQMIHLYLGLISGLIITITCFTGAVLVFEEEINHILYSKRYFVDVEKEKVKLDTMVSNLKKVEPKAIVTSIKTYSDPSKTVSIKYKEGKDNEAFVNPYNGEVIETYTYKKTFFYQMFALHRWLLADKVGKFIVGVSTLFFVFILISGLIIWWKPQKNIIQQRLKLKFSKNFKVFNYNFHVVTGFYSSIFLIIFAFTGLVWSFEWFNNGIYVLTNTENKRVGVSPKSSQSTGQPISIDSAFDIGQKIVSNSNVFTLDLPKDESDSYRVTTLNNNSPHSSAFDYIFIDQYKGELISKSDYQDRNLGQKIRSYFKPIHTSGILGIPGKIIGFISCILGTVFPISGAIIWFNRTRKKSVKPKENELLKV